MAISPARALVLAAGFGTRLRPLTEQSPKPLMPLWGIPLIDRTLRKLEDWGVGEVVVNLHWRADRLRAYLQSRKGKAAIVFSEEKEILGTGGALRPLAGRFDGPFWIVNADVAWSIEPQPFLDALDAPRAWAASWLDPRRGPRTVEADRRGRVTCFRSMEPGIHGTYTFCGLTLATPEIFKYLPDKAFCTLVEVFENAMAEGRLVQGVAAPKCYWSDMGDAASFLRTHAEVKRLAAKGAAGGELYNPKLDVLPPENAAHFFCVCRGADVAVGVKGRDSVVLPGAKVLAGSSLADCIIGGGTVGGALADCVCVPAADLGAEPALPELAKALGWPLAKTAAFCLGKRGSDRTFWRLMRGRDSAIAISYTDVRPENARYAGHAALLAEAGVPVPALLADFPERRFQAWEDWGADSLQARMEKHPERAVALYTPLMKAVAQFHREASRLALERGAGLEPAFDAALYAWERGLFETHLLRERYGYEAIPADVEAELEGVAQKLLSLPRVIVHRDLQSSNVLFRGSAFALIDFQGMRWGAASYDLASLLMDPYVKISAADREALLRVYAGALPEQAAAVALFYEGAVQRLTQALGAYGRLASVGQPAFTRHISRGLELLHEAAEACKLEALAGLTHEFIEREKMCACRRPV